MFVRVNRIKRYLKHFKRQQSKCQSIVLAFFPHVHQIDPFIAPFVFIFETTRIFRLNTSTRKTVEEHRSARVKYRSWETEESLVFQHGNGNFYFSFMEPFLTFVFYHHYFTQYCYTQHCYTHNNYTYYLSLKHLSYSCTIIIFVSAVQNKLVRNFC